MSFFVIAKPGSSADELDSPVFGMGSDDEDAVAVFLNERSAREYLQEHGWDQEETVAEMRPTELVKWLSVAHDQGIQQVIVRPAEVTGGKGVLNLRNPYQGFADLLEMLRKTAAPRL